VSRARSMLAFAVLALAATCAAQDPLPEAVFPQSPQQVEAALKKLPGATSGSLPLLEGFVIPGKNPLDQYSRPFYQYIVKVSAAPAGSRVRVSARITAWHKDGSHPRYEMLPSNGRLEADLLGRLRDSLGAQVVSAGGAPAAGVPKNSPQPEISAPLPQFPSRANVPANSDSEAAPSGAQQEAANLEEILRNQSHPTNLVAIRQDRTPVLDGARLDAKVLFLASAEDEFEALDMSPEWVHVRISGLSRGWVRRSSVEILDGSSPPPSARSQSATEPSASPAPQVTASSPSAASTATATSTFIISSEEVGSFPGSWAPLQGKSVKILTLQQAAGTGRISSPHDKLNYAGALLKQSASALGQAEGIVLVFDSEDGGMIAATRSSLEKWRQGMLRDSEFWKQCLLDPREILGGQ
jgi:hypothetical protein